MREIEWSAAFKRDIRREGKGANLLVLNEILPNVLSIIANDIQLPANYQDHKLTGKWVGCKECHIKPDLLLIYAKTDDNRLWLARLGSHTELFD